MPSLIAGVVLLPLSGCGAPSPSEEATSRGEGQAVTVEAKDFRFSPRTVDMEPGRRLTVTVENRGLVSHTFTADDPAVDVVVPAGEKREVTLTATGRVAFFCRFHITEGMQGALCPRDEECSAPLFP